MEQINVENLVQEAKEKKLKSSKIAGIYAIYCMENKKIYIGHSQRLDTRFSQHRADLKAGKHINIYLQNVYNKHGLESLEFLVIEHCKEQKDRFLREKFYIENIDPKFLINLSPPLNLEYGKLPPTFINEEWRAKISKSLTGRKLSDSHRENMRKSARTFKPNRNRSSKYPIAVLATGELLQINNTGCIQIKGRTYSYTDMSCKENEPLTIKTGQHEVFATFIQTNSRVLKVIPAKTSYYFVEGGIVISGVEYLFEKIL